MNKLTKETLDIELQDKNGIPVKLSDFIGKYVVLYFYPKDDTPGCTLEACSFRDANDEIKAMGVEVLGVSKDDVKSHQKFSKKYHLNFNILSDPEKLLNQAFGVWQEKKFMGRKYMGTARTTFIINPSGEIVKEFQNVKPNGHSEEILEALKEILKK